MAASIDVDGQKIARLRKEHLVVTQAEFGKRLGLSRSGMWLIEVGAQRTSPETLRKMARKLGVAPQELMRDNGN